MAGIIRILTMALISGSFETSSSSTTEKTEQTTLLTASSTDVVQTLFCPESCSCLKTIVRCTKKYFIPHLFKNTTEFHMPHNFLGPDINGSMTSFHEIRILDLSGNNIRSLEPDFFSGLIRLKFLNLSGNSLEQLPDDIFSSNSDLEILDLDKNKFYILPAKSFRFLIRLKTLKLSKNQLISPFLDIRFQVMIRLSTLDMSHNNFRELPQNSFDVIKKWDATVPKYIDLSYCNIETVEDDALTAIRGLMEMKLAGNKQMSQENLTSALRQLQNSDIRRLDISYMNISIIQTVLANFTETSLEELNISHNAIDIIPPDSLDFVVSLKKLDISWNQIKSLTGGLKDLENLQYLDISHNHIKRIDSKDVERLSSLRSLILSNNIFKIIPDGTFSGLPRLNNLDLSNNNIESFDLSAKISKSLRSLNIAGNKLIVTSALVNIPKLRHLDISRNKLKDLSRFLLRNCPDIHTVNFSGNHITTVNHQVFKPYVPKVIDLSFNYLYTIKNFNWFEAEEIYLQGNLISKIDFQGFFAMNRLSHLDLSQNQIQSINKDTFNYLTNLTTLLLQGNQLTFDPHKASLFRFMTNLKYLDLSKNSISKLRASMFTRCEKLEYLSLANNEFSTFNSEIVSGLTSLSELHLDINPYHCSCNLLGFKIWLLGLKDSTQPLANKNLLCMSPKERHGTPIQNYFVTEFECHHMLVYIIVVCSLVGLGLLVCVTVTLVCHFYNRWLKTRSLPDDDDNYQYEETMMPDSKFLRQIDASQSILKDAKSNGYISHSPKHRHEELKPIKKLKLKVKKRKHPRRSNSVTFGLPISRTADYIMNIEEMKRSPYRKSDPRLRRSRSLDFRRDEEPIYSQPLKVRRDQSPLPPTYGDHIRRRENVFQQYPRMQQYPRRRPSNDYRSHLPFSYLEDPNAIAIYGTSRRRRPINAAVGDYLDLPLVTYRRRHSNTPPFNSMSLPRNMGGHRGIPETTENRRRTLPISNGRIPSEFMRRADSHSKIEWV